MALAESMYRNVFSRFLANVLLHVFTIFIWIETIILELLPQPLGTPAHNLHYSKTLSLLKQHLWQFVVIKSVFSEGKISKVMLPNMTAGHSGDRANTELEKALVNNPYSHHLCC